MISQLKEKALAEYRLRKNAAKRKCVSGDEPSTSDNIDPDSSATETTGLNLSITLFSQINNP